MCSYLLLRHFQFRTQLDRLRDALVLVFLGSLGAMSISACAGTAALIATGVAPPAELGHVWMVWWSSDALGVLTVTPLLLVVRNCRTLIGRYRWPTWLELAMLLVTTFAVMLVATRVFGFIFLAFPLVLWAAWRFQLVAATPCALLISAIAIDAAAHGYGLFSGRSILADLAILQVFNASVVLTGLVFSVLIAQWRQSRADIEQTCERLTEVVDRLQKAMLPSRSYFANVPNLNASPAHDTAKATRTWAIHLGQSSDHLRIRQRDQGTA
jgi:integral membrane sensor domain MASE1